MAEQSTVPDPRANFNARDYADAYLIDRDSGHSHLFSVRDAYKYATRSKPDGLTVTIRDSDTTITNSDGTVPNA